MARLIPGLFIVLTLCGGIASAQASTEPVSAITLKTIDGWQLPAKYQPPAEGRPVIVFLHSYRRDKNVWDVFSAEVARLGYGYLALDMRGHGGSTFALSTYTVTYASFRKTGTDNEFNQMVRDAEAALKYLEDNGIPENRVILIGAGIGANIAIKTGALHQSLMMIGLLTPTFNAGRDIPSVNPLRAYGKRPVLLVAGADSKRLLGEAMILKSVAQSVAGPENVTFCAEYKGDSEKLIKNADVRARVIQWLKTPSRPPEIAVSTGAPAALEPSVAVSTEPAAGDDEAEADGQ